jgi:uncharacterized membrane protein
MRTPASIAGHPIHVMLVTLPIGLWVFSLVCDVILLLGHNADLWFTVAYITMAGGLVGALLAAIFGVIDLVALPRGPARHLALIHMTVNLVVVALFAWNLWLRTGELESWRGSRRGGATRAACVAHRCAGQPRPERTRRALAHMSRRVA